MKFVIATLTTGLLSTGATAGSAVLVDPNESAVHSWSGAYLGVNAGYAYGISRNKYKHFTYSEFDVTLSILGENLVAGVQTGYNWRFGSTVFGVETDVQYSPMKIGHYSSSVEMDWAGTARGRLGFLPEERLLVYVTGGIAVGQLEFVVSEYSFAVFCGPGWRL